MLEPPPVVTMTNPHFLPVAGARVSHRDREIHSGIKESRHHLHIVQAPIKAEDQCLQPISEHVSMLPIVRPSPSQILNEGRTPFALQNYIHIAFGYGALWSRWLILEFSRIRRAIERTAPCEIRSNSASLYPFRHPLQTA